MQYTKLESYVMSILQRDLAADLTYHCPEHTQDVIKETVVIGLAENIAEYELCLLKTAALFHDSGFLNGYGKHEISSCIIAKEILPRYEYKETEINLICELIMATQVPQNPKNKLEEIICDADLDYLGRDDFDVISETLFAEFLAYKIITDRNHWNKVQRSFLVSHHYWTNTSKVKRAPLKEVHLNHIKSMIVE